jgi:hypothetical protein
MASTSPQAEPPPSGPARSEPPQSDPTPPAAETPASARDQAAWEARRLLRAARSGSLATQSAGQPFASLVTPACMHDGSLLLLLSRLAEHTRHLLADPRCSIMVSGAPTSENPQTTPRLTITGSAEITTDPALKARFLALHPYASLYAGFTDFATWRITPEAALLVGGFARAFRLKPADLAPDPEAAATILAAEPAILAHCNQDHPDALAAIAGTQGDWQMVTADVDGFDLAKGERVVRFPWSAPVKDANDVRRDLVTLARQARGG